MTLLFNAVFFSILLTEPSLPKMFVFILLGMFLLGMCISIVVSFFVFPSFATLDVEQRFSFCLSNVQRIFYLLVQSFLSSDRVHARMLLSRASILEEMIRSVMSPIPTRLFESTYEPSEFLQRIFYRNRHRLIQLSVEGLSNVDLQRESLTVV